MGPDLVGELLLGLREFDDLRDQLQDAPTPDARLPPEGDGLVDDLGERDLGLYEFVGEARDGPLEADLCSD